MGYMYMCCLHQASFLSGLQMRFGVRDTSSISPSCLPSCTKRLALVSSLRIVRPPLPSLPHHASVQLGEENSRMKHEWLADQTQLVSSAMETEQLAEKVGFEPRLAVDERQK